MAYDTLVREAKDLPEDVEIHIKKGNSKPFCL